MTDCDECGKTVGMPYTCNRCGNAYCSDHRLPESHRCGTVTHTSPASGEPTIPEPDGNPFRESSSQESESNSSLNLWIGVLLLPIYAPLKLLPYILRPIPLLLIIGGIISASLTVGTGVAIIDDTVSTGASAADDAVSQVENADVSAPDIDSSEPNGTEIERKIHQRVNEKREEHDLQPLNYSSEVSEVASYHSEDMADRGYFSHDSPNGESMTDRYAKFDVSCAGGENLFKLEGDFTRSNVPEQAVESWMDSPEHRKNMLSERFQVEGIGVEFTDDAVYVTQNFC